MQPEQGSSDLSHSTIKPAHLVFGSIVRAGTAQHHLQVDVHLLVHMGALDLSLWILPAVCSPTRQSHTTLSERGHLWSDIFVDVSHSFDWGGEVACVRKRQG